MQDEMTRGRSQVIWRYMPDSIFRYNGNGAWCRVIDVTMHKTSELKGGLASALIDKLSYWNALGATGFPDPINQPNKYSVGEPYWVRYDLWPTIFMCSDCKRMHWYQTLSNLKQYNEHLQCRTCGSKGSTLKQISFAFVCECGDMQTIFIPKCPSDNSHPICLKDVGSFQESFWYCQVCKTPIQRDSRDGLGVRACQCGKTMSGITLIDPRVYYSQTLSIVDIQPEILTTWKENENFPILLLGAVLKISSYKPSDIQNLSRYKTKKDEMSPELLAMKTMLLKQGMPEDQVEKLIKQSMEQASSDPWGRYHDELSACKNFVSSYDFANSRQTVEYVFARDEPSTISINLDSLIAQVRSNGDVESYTYLEKTKELAASLGLINMAVIQELPIMLAGIGYSRYFASPIDYDGTNNDTKLRPYKIEEGGKIPIYVARNTTEALMYELDPLRIASFLELNKVVKIPIDSLASDSMIRAWLLSISGKLYESEASHLQLLSFEKERGVTVDLPTALIFGVLHTISHILKATAHQYVGIDQDTLAEYLFPLYRSGFLYASSHVKFTLGGIDAVFRANLSQWLGTVRDFANDCSFDPVCAQDGGACLACLYTKFGCNYFNRTLSRSFLFGGKVRGLESELVGFWSPEVTNETEKLQKSLDKGR